MPEMRATGVSVVWRIVLKSGIGEACGLDLHARVFVERALGAAVERGDGFLDLAFRDPHPVARRAQFLERRVVADARSDAPLRESFDTACFALPVVRGGACRFEFGTSYRELGTHCFELVAGGGQLGLGALATAGFRVRRGRLIG